MRAAMPYAIVGGIRFYERKEIKDLLAYLRVLANPGRRREPRAHHQHARRAASAIRPSAALRNAAREAGHLDRRAAAARQTPVPGLAAELGRTRARPSPQLLDAAPRRARRRFARERCSSGCSSSRRIAIASRTPAPSARRGSRTSTSCSRSRATSTSARAADEDTRARLGRFLEEAALVTDWDRQDDEPRSADADDAAHVEGARVPGRVHPRHGGGDLPAPAHARRSRRRSRRNAGFATSA